MSKQGSGPAQGGKAPKNVARIENTFLSISFQFIFYLSDFFVKDISSVFCCSPRIPRDWGTRAGSACSCTQGAQERRKKVRRGETGICRRCQDFFSVKGCGFIRVFSLLLSLSCFAVFQKFFYKCLQDSSKLKHPL